MRHVASVLREEGVRSRHVDLAMCGDNSTSDATYQGALEVIEEAPVAFARCIALHTPRADPVLLKARHRGVLRALERREANTINSPSAAAIALSKASQLMWFSRRGIAVPRTLLTNDAHAARDFLGEVGSVVVKPVSGRRSIVRALAESDVSRLHLLANCPVILQELLGGSSCRVHVVRQYAESIEIRSNALDYREVPGGADYRLCDIPRPLRDSVIEAASELGLWLSGWDLKWHVQQHRWLALEVNRMPAIEYYEHRTDASRVSRALCATLNPSSI
ncbi:MAG: hypothetical protein IT361_02680 [Gemmatimonadaceae bacterium]|nr:hypothetical protein [Gemmatimonadaceae bacterium]